MSEEKEWMFNRLPTEEVIKSIEEKFPNKFNCEDILYTHSSTPFTVTCRDCNTKTTLDRCSLLRRKVPCRECERL